MCEKTQQFADVILLVSVTLYGRSSTQEHGKQEYFFFLTNLVFLHAFNYCMGRLYMTF
jgi:hypothetical protein